MKTSHGHLDGGTPLVSREAANRRGGNEGRTLPRTARNRPQIRVLVIEESPSVMSRIHLLLETQDDVVIVGSVMDGWHAVRYAWLLMPTLVIMSAELPRIDCFEAAGSIKGFKDPPQVVLTSSGNSASIRHRALEAGADAFLFKSPKLESGLGRILMAARRGAPLSPSPKN